MGQRRCPKALETYPMTWHNSKE